MFHQKIIPCFIFCLFLASCGPNSVEEFQQEGEGIIHSLIFELQSIHTREELIHTIPNLQSLFNELTDLSIAAQQYAEKHSAAQSHEISEETHKLNEQLRIEMTRLFQIDGAIELIEKCQEPSLQKLADFERKK